MRSHRGGGGSEELPNWRLPGRHRYSLVGSAAILDSMTIRFGPLTCLERSRIVEALQFARTEPERMRPMLNESEAATFDMMRRLRAAQADAAPSVPKLAEYLGWTRSAVMEQLESLRRKGFVQRASDCTTYLETVEAVGFRGVVPLVAMALVLLRATRGTSPRHVSHTPSTTPTRLRFAADWPSSFPMASSDRTRTFGGCIGSDRSLECEASLVVGRSTPSRSPSALGRFDKRQD